MNTNKLQEDILAMNKKILAMRQEWLEKASKELAERGIENNTPIRWGLNNGWFSRLSFGHCSSIYLYYHPLTSKGKISKTERVDIIKDTNEIQKICPLIEKS